jgi:hypothetical protein
VEIASGTFTVPADHDGEIFFAVKARAQGDPNDPAGNAFLWLEIDGQRLGSTGVQGLGGPIGTAGTSVSQRTLSASYLATGSGALAPGSHTVKAYAQVNGQFMHLSFHNDKPLMIWFD